MTMKKFLYSFMMMGLLIFLSGNNVGAYTVEECVECHKLGSDKSKLHMPFEEFKGSVHYREDLTCMDCHMDVTDENHETKKGSGAVDCSECHDEENLHGQEAAMEDRKKEGYF